MTNLTWKPQALLHYPLIEHVHVSPGGQNILYTVRTPHMTDDASEFRDRVFVTQAQDKSVPRQLTHDASASMPRWSPDGAQIAFLRARVPDAQTGSSQSDSSQAGGKDKTLWIMAAHGGEARRLLPPDDAEIAYQNIRQFAWRPDGKAIAFTAVPHTEQRRRRKRQKDDVQQWRVDYDFAHLFLVEFGAESDGESEADVPPQPEKATWRQLTSGRLHVECLAWHPHSTELAFIAQDTPYLESWPSSRLLRLALQPDSGTPQAAPVEQAKIASWKSAPGYSPDGQWLACQAGIENNRWAYAGQMHIFPVGSTPETAPRILAQVSDAQPGLIGWMPDSRHVLVANDKGHGTEVLALPVDGSPPLPVVTGDEPISAFHVGKSGLLALVRQNYHKLNGIETVDLQHTASQNTVRNGNPIESIHPRRIATPHAPEYPAGPLPQVHELQWQTPDGFDIEGILYLPNGYDPTTDTKLPLLLHIHGGPMSVFQRAYAGAPYYYTPATLCEQGFAVLRCNPRGSSGYGKDFRFANIQDWGSGDYRDLMQGVDTVIEMGIADPARLGVCGWSYGGFMSSWIITQTHRFQAASIGAPVTNPMSFSATADIPGFVPDFYGGEAWEVFDFYRDHSPIFHAHKVRTPAILQHGADDERVPLEQGLQYYHVLARNNVPVELFIYPRQGHAILEPRLLMDAMQRNLEWFADTLLSEKIQRTQE